MKRTVFYLFICISTLVLFACSKSSTETEEGDPYRYQYPQYRDGHVGFYHSFYGRDCGDTTYWNGEATSKEFNAGDSLFLLISEEVGSKGENPDFTLQETALLECSNGDRETVTFNLPYPSCVINIQDFFLRFSAVASKSNGVENYNGFIDVQGDSIVVVAKYKSYWTGRIVMDTAYVYP